MGVSASSSSSSSRLLAADDICLGSTPVGLQYEKFIIPDAVRILDAIVETLTY